MTLQRELRLLARDLEALRERAAQLAPRLLEDEQRRYHEGQVSTVVGYLRHYHDASIPHDVPGYRRHPLYRAMVWCKVLHLRAGRVEDREQRRARRGKS